METQAYQAVRTRLLLFTHGEMEWAQVADGDPPLSDAGRAAVELVAASLPRFDHVAASRQRASLETGEVLSAIRGVPLWLRDDLDEVRAIAPVRDFEAYLAWLDGLFDSGGATTGGESIADGVHRLTVALRALGDQFHGRTVLVASHPVILLGFRGEQLRASVTREQAEMLPEPALAIVDYLEGRFYLVEDFPMRWRPPGT